MTTNLYKYTLVASPLVALFSCGEAPKSDVHARPNILFCIADDMSYFSAGAYGCDWVSTPNFDRVAQDGILLNNCYTPNAKSAPSRSCIVTGLNSWQLEDACNHYPKFPAKFTSYVEVLAANGYDVAYTGKGWAPGDPGVVNGRARELTGKNYSDIKCVPLTTGISDIDYAENFKAFHRDVDGEKPWAFWCGGLEPHRRYEYGTGASIGGKSIDEIDEVPAFWPDNATVRNDLLDYAFEVEHFDQHIGRILEYLEERGELDNTLVVFTADNGMPFPRIKGQEYELSNHLPMAIMWADKIKNPGRKVEDFVNFIDLAPTFLEAAGIDWSEMNASQATGNSMFDIFESSESFQNLAYREYVLIGKERHDVGRPNDEGYPIRGIVRDGMLYLKNYDTNRWPAGNPETGYLNCDGGATKSVILDMRRNECDQRYWSLSFGKRVSEELYNIKEDKYCLNNLAGNSAFASIKDELSALMQEELVKQGDPRALGHGEVFDNYPYDGVEKDYYDTYLSGEMTPVGWVSATDYESEKLD